MNGDSNGRVRPPYLQSEADAVAGAERGRRLSRREREQLAHRQEILEAAERVFARHGFHGATMEQIAREADFAVGTLYNFFKSKEDLYHAVVGDIFQRAERAFRNEVLTKDDPRAAIEALVDLRLRFFRSHRAFARVVFETVHVGRLGPRLWLPREHLAGYDRAMHELADVLQRGIEQGIFVEGEPFALALVVHGALNAFIAHWVQEADEEPTEPRVEDFRRSLLACLLRGPSTGGDDED